MIGRPFEVRFRQSAARLFPELARLPKIARPNGKTDLEMDPEELGIICAIEGQASHVVFLDRRPSCAEGASTELLAPEEARTLLYQSIYFGDAAIRAEQERALERLLRLPLVRLRYSSLNFGERALRALVTED